MISRPTRRSPSRSGSRASSSARTCLRWSLVLSCACCHALLACADDPGLPAPKALQQMANDNANGAPTESNGAGVPGGEATSSPGANGDPNGAGLGINPSPPPPPTMTQLPTQPTAPSSTAGAEPTTAPSTEPTDPSEDEPADMPAGGQFGGFFGTGAGDDTSDADDSVTDDSAMLDDTTAEPPADTGGTGAVFGGGFGATPPAATSTTPTAVACTPLAVGLASGDIGTEAKCFTVTGTLQGWQVSNLAMRSLTINGAPAAAPSLPAAMDGGYTFEFGAGEPTYTAFSTW